MEKVFDAFEDQHIIGSEFQHSIAKTLLLTRFTQNRLSLFAVRRVTMIGQHPGTIRPLKATSKFTSEGCWKGRM